MNIQIKSLIAGTICALMISTGAVHAKDVGLASAKAPSVATTVAKDKLPVNYSFLTVIRTINSSQPSTGNQSANAEINIQLHQSRNFATLESCNNEKTQFQKLFGADIKIETIPSSSWQGVAKATATTTFGECTPSM